MSRNESCGIGSALIAEPQTRGSRFAIHTIPRARGQSPVDQSAHNRTVCFGRYSLPPSELSKILVGMLVFSIVGSAVATTV